ncbi:hypothetical protein ABGB19_13095 [Mycobacterium sp. B14F4]|uniref:hypothetical protein n=1 Tax=Mycobacterium sp. B14F4 TaxID=3153565 RepID=UPI00325D9241
MNDVTTTVRPSPATALPQAAGEPTLITEQQLLFATAAAVASPPVRPRRWAAAFCGTVRGLVESPATPARRHNPRRYAYLEVALMSREMHRL